MQCETGAKPRRRASQFTAWDFPGHQITGNKTDPGAHSIGVKCYEYEYLVVKSRALGLHFSLLLKSK